MSVQPNKAIVGANAFRHQSGIHQDGILKMRQTYEIMDANDIGWPTGGAEIVLGKVSGRHGFNARLEALGYELTRRSCRARSWPSRSWRTRRLRSTTATSKRWSRTSCATTAELTA